MYRTLQYLLLGILMSGGCFPLGAQTQTFQVAFKKPGPLFILPTYDGKVVKSSTLKGKVILLEFFQTWCPDCQKSAPVLQSLYQKYKDQGFVVVGISHDKEREKAVEPFVKKYNLGYPVCLGDLSIAINYISGFSPEKPSFRIPYLVFIDRTGMIVGQYEEGKNPEATDPPFIEKEIQRLLKESVPTP
jgi:peroxiredoxin